MSYNDEQGMIEVQLDGAPAKSGFLFETPDHVRDFFAELMLQWSKLTGNKRIIWLIEDTGLTLAPAASKVYLSQIDFITQITAQDVFVYGTGPAPGTVKPEAKRFPTRAKALAAMDDRRKSANKTASMHHIDVVKKLRNGITLSFDTKHHIVESRTPPRPANKRYFLDTIEDVDNHITDVRETWKYVTNGHQVFFVIDYENFEANPDHMQRYVRMVNDLFAETSSGVVRCNASLLQSTAIRYATMRSSTPSNLFKDRAAALAAVEAMQDGRVKFSGGDARAPRTAKCDNGTELVFNPDTQLLEVKLPPPRADKTYLHNSVAEVRRYMQDLTVAWTELTGGQQVFWLINCANFSVNPTVRDAFNKDAVDLLRVAAKGVVRYNTSLAQTIALRHANAGSIAAVHISNTREEALAALETMRKASVKD